MSTHTQSQAEALITKLQQLSSEETRAGQARFGVVPANSLGVKIPDIEYLARDVDASLELAEALWASGIHEARILAAVVCPPRSATLELANRWAADFDSWDLCDQCCNRLFRRTPFAWELAADWTDNPNEFVKRAGFVMLAVLAVHDKASMDARFLAFFNIIRREAEDERLYVKKAVNWALRQIGKRNPALNKEALELASELKNSDHPAAHWIGRDAVAELGDEAVQNRMAKMTHSTDIQDTQK